MSDFTLSIADYIVALQKLELQYNSGSSLMILQAYTNQIAEMITSSLENSNAIVSYSDDGSSNDAPDSHTDMNSDDYVRSLEFILPYVNLLIDRNDKVDDIQIGECIQLCISILCNMSILEANVNILFDQLVWMSATTDADKNDKRSELTTVLHRIVMKYVSYNPQIESSIDASAASNIYHDVGNLLTNLCQVPAGRNFVLSKATNYVEGLIVQITSMNIQRSRGSIATLRTLLFDKDIHWWMVNELNIVTPLLMTLVRASIGSEPLTEAEKVGMDPILWMKAAACDSTNSGIVYKDISTEKEECLRMVLESILLLCQTRPIREDLRKKKVYVIVRNFDYTIPSAKEEDIGAAVDSTALTTTTGTTGTTESNKTVTLSDLIFEIVQFMMRDEEKI